MKLFGLLTGTLVYSVGSIAKNRPVRKVFDLKRNTSSGNVRVQGSFNISDKEQVFYTLKTRVIAYREEINGLYSQFNSGKFLLNIPFKKISSDFSDSDKQYKIYSSLGYDMEVIKQLGNVLNKLDFNSPHFINIDADVAYKLLKFLNNITDYAKTLVNYYLSDETLLHIKSSKDKLRITEIYNHLEDFITLRENCMSKIKLQIAYLESKITRESVLTGMKEMVAYEGEIGQDINLMSTIAITIWSLS
ncbi:hypothetical protein [Borrelia crocidurae]|uniref:Uncharacterized protein n=2 Tax=Borrelia crocidurae TaxID=29520 RepID=W5SJV3_9SPIR|nr:hypothetical protein [Borrelia crocidurae]AFI31772.1 hypothetical protein Q7M_1064 [Borrelia crocidurae str. Achema]AHH07399.1 Hypothetical protein BCD_1333 [Borrelia crocidurae DOU]